MTVVTAFLQLHHNIKETRCAASRSFGKSLVIPGQNPSASQDNNYIIRCNEREQGIPEDYKRRHYGWGHGGGGELKRQGRALYRALSPASCHPGRSPHTSPESSHSTSDPVFTLAEHRDIKRGWWQQKIWCGMQGAQWLRCSGTTYRDGTGWEAGGRCKRGHVYTYDWLTLMYGRDKHNILQLKVNTILESQGKKKKYIYI